MSQVIPESAVEAVALGIHIQGGVNVTRAREYARAAIEAAAPHMLAGAIDDREEVEAQVKSIVQEVAMSVDYTERLYAAVQKIMAVTIPKPTP